MFELIKPLLSKITKMAISRILGEKADVALSAIDEVLSENREEISAELDAQREFFLKYFGALGELHPIAQVLRASVRPVITFAFTAALFVGLAKGVVPWEMVAGIFASIIGFWFGERSALKVPKGM